MLLHDERRCDASLLHLLLRSSRGNNTIRGNVSVWSTSFCTILYWYMIEEFGESEMSGHARDNHLSRHSHSIFEN